MPDTAPGRAKKVAERLMAPDMWTGWGIRTLSADHPAFNPYNYQTGSVSPHDNAIIAMGFKFYGFAAEAAWTVHDISTAASHFLLNQLPELYTAFARDEPKPRYGLWTTPGTAPPRIRRASLPDQAAGHATGHRRW